MQKAVPIKIAIDGSPTDRFKIENGQFRYLVDLVTGLARYKANYRFVLLGSHAKPLEIIQGIPGFCDWEYACVSRPMGRGSYYRSLFSYNSTLRRLGAHLLHTLTGFVPIFTPCPVVATRLDLMYELFPEYEEARKTRIYRLERWLTQNVARRIIAISKTTAQDLHSRWRISHNRIDVVMLGSDFSNKSRSESQLKSKYLLTPFNLEPRKNLHALLQAWATIVKKYPDRKLVCFGKTSWTQDRQNTFDKQISELSISSSIVLTGFIDDDVLCDLYEGAELFVAPTLYEGFGLPILEAMARGCCVVARNQSAMAEIVADYGILTETADPKQLAGSICDILLDSKRRERLASEGQRRAQIFSIDQMAQETILVYKRALGGS